MVSSPARDCLVWPGCHQILGPAELVRVYWANTMHKSMHSVGNAAARNNARSCSGSILKLACGNDASCSTPVVPSAACINAHRVTHAAGSLLALGERRCLAGRGRACPLGWAASPVFLAGSATASQNVVLTKIQRKDLGTLGLIVLTSGEHSAMSRENGTGFCPVPRQRDKGGDSAHALVIAPALDKAS